MASGDVFSPNIRRALPHERTPFNRLYESCLGNKKRKRGDSSSPTLRKKRKRVRKTPGGSTRTVSQSPSSCRLSTPTLDFEEKKSESLQGISCDFSRSRSSKTSTPGNRTTPKPKYIQTNLHFPRRESVETYIRRQSIEVLPKTTPKQGVRCPILRSPQQIIRKEDGSKRIIPEYLGNIITHTPRSKRIVPEFLGPLPKKKFKLKKKCASTSKLTRRAKSTPRKKHVRPTFVGPLDDEYIVDSPDSSFRHPDGTKSNPGPMSSVKKAPTITIDSAEHRRLSIFALLD